MKTLKFDHKIAKQVVSGSKQVTWRMDDQQNISVDDHIQIIDKVKPDDKLSWVPVTEVIVNKVISIRLGSISKNEFLNNELYKSPEEMLLTFQKYYGEKVSLDSPIKIIHFSQIIKAKQQKADKVVNIATLITDKNQTYKLFTDGGSRGNPGPSAGAYVVLDSKDKVLQTDGHYIGITTNNQAEYQALKLGLECAHKLGITRIHVYMDSLLVVNQLNGIFKVKNRDLWPIYQSTAEFAKNFRDISFSHVPRELNKYADTEVNRILDEQKDS